MDCLYPNNSFAMFFITNFVFQLIIQIILIAITDFKKSYMLNTCKSNGQYPFSLNF